MLPTCLGRIVLEEIHFDHLDHLNHLDHANHLDLETRCMVGNHGSRGKRGKQGKRGKKGSRGKRGKPGQTPTPPPPSGPSDRIVSEDGLASVIAESGTHIIAALSSGTVFDADSNATVVQHGDSTLSLGSVLEVAIQGQQVATFHSGSPLGLVLGEQTPQSSQATLEVQNSSLPCQVFVEGANGGSVFDLVRVNNDIAAKNPVLNGDDIAQIRSRGWTGPGFGSLSSPTAQIAFIATENFVSPSNLGTKISFSTVPNGSNALGERMSLDDIGLIVGAAGPAAARLEAFGPSGTTFRMRDGSQGPGKVLVSDATGFASWGNVSSLLTTANVFFTAGVGSSISLAVPPSVLFPIVIPGSALLNNSADITSPGNTCNIQYVGLPSKTLTVSVTLNVQGAVGDELNFWAVKNPGGVPVNGAATRVTITNALTFVPVCYVFTWPAVTFDSLVAAVSCSSATTISIGSLNIVVLG
jgi:hypothetical protein